jgi:phage shock protein PspC (stress-responsive transcriptional regulator)
MNAYGANATRGYNTMNDETMNDETGTDETVNEDTADAGPGPYTRTERTERTYRTDRAGRPPLRRAYDGRMLAGVAAGIADYLGVDALIVRVAFAVFTVVGGASIPAYLACVLLIPEEGSDTSIATSLLESVR